MIVAFVWGPLPGIAEDLLINVLNKMHNLASSQQNAGWLPDPLSGLTQCQGCPLAQYK